MEILLTTFTEEIESQQDKNLSQDDSDVPKTKTKKKKEEN